MVGEEELKKFREGSITIRLIMQKALDDAFSTELEKDCRDDIK